MLWSSLPQEVDDQTRDSFKNKLKLCCLIQPSHQLIHTDSDGIFVCLPFLPLSSFLPVKKKHLIAVSHAALLFLLLHYIHKSFLSFLTKNILRFEFINH